MSWFHCPQCHEPIWHVPAAGISCHGCGALLRILVFSGIVLLVQVTEWKHPAEQPHSHQERPEYPKNLRASFEKAISATGSSFRAVLEDRWNVREHTTNVTSTSNPSS